MSSRRNKFQSVDWVIGGQRRRILVKSAISVSLHKILFPRAPAPKGTFTIIIGPKTNLPLSFSTMPLPREAFFFSSSYRSISHSTLSFFWGFVFLSCSHIQSIARRVVVTERADTFSSRRISRPRFLCMCAALQICSPSLGRSFYSRPIDHDLLSSLYVTTKINCLLQVRLLGYAKKWHYTSKRFHNRP